MDFNTIMRTTDPNVLRTRLTQIDQQIGALGSERELVDACFQKLLAQNAKRPDLSIRPDRHERVRTGHEEENPLNNTGKIL
jgi:hypothetical protein